MIAMNDGSGGDIDLEPERQVTEGLIEGYRCACWTFHFKKCTGAQMFHHVIYHESSSAHLHPHHPLCLHHPPEKGRTHTSTPRSWDCTYDATAAAVTRSMFSARA